MPKKPNSRTCAVVTKISVAERESLDKRCALLGVQPSEFVRRLVLRELGVEPVPTTDSAETLLRLFVATMQASLEDEDSPSALTLERFEKLVDECAPGLLESDGRTAHRA